MTGWLSDQQHDETAHAAALDLAARYAAWAAHTPAGRAAHRGGVLFRAPRKLDYMKLVPVAAEPLDGVSAWKLPSDHALRQRDGFALTDAGTDLVGGLDQAHYCIWCHEQGKDSCARGLLEKKPIEGDVPFKKSPFNVTLAGCPLDERISEFHKLRAEGVPLGRARDDLHRQPDGRRHRPPDLQRLHEVVHLPEAGSGRHSAIGNAVAERRAGAAVGVRDLFAPDALESAQPAPPAAAAAAPARGC